MNKITKTQRDQLIGVAAGAVAVAAGLWFFVVMAQQQQLTGIKQKSAQLSQKIKSADTLIRSGGEIGLQLTNRQEILQKREAGLAPEHDPYSWIIRTVDQFILSKGVNINQFSTADISEKGVIPKFPYKWATFHLSGVGFYHDFGKFFADFENSFPYFSIQNVEISAGGQVEVPEKLTFKFDIVTPLVPTGQETK
jgi:Tfp pilus assembly protein PilO